MTTKPAKVFLATAILLMGSLPMGCPVWRTEHKVETTHKIEAHIIIDIRRELSQIEQQVREEPVPKAQPDGKPSSMLTVGEREIRYASFSLGSIFDLASSAHAAQSPEDQKKAIDARRARSKQIDEALLNGCLGENEKGYAEVRPCDAAKDRTEQARIKKLADDENRDRGTIYSAVASRQEGLTAGMVAEFNAAEIRARLKKGQLFQIPSKNDVYAEFRATPLGKALRNPKKGAWVKSTVNPAKKD